jgi:hypothetical protein
VIDIVAGFILAGVCCWLIREKFPRFRTATNGMIQRQDEL